MWSDIATWLKAYESIAIWLEGIALVLLFIWELKGGWRILIQKSRVGGWHILLKKSWVAYPFGV